LNVALVIKDTTEALIIGVANVIMTVRVMLTNAQSVGLFSMKMHHLKLVEDLVGTILFSVYFVFVTILFYLRIEK